MKIDILESSLGFEQAIGAMRNSWSQYANRADSKVVDGKFVVGPADKELIRKLIVAGPSHRKFLRMIFCYANITAPFYWWKQFDTHRYGVEKISESTMHSILVKPFEPVDFEPLDISDEVIKGKYDSYMNVAIAELNSMRNKAFESEDRGIRKQCEKAIYHMLPDSYLQKRTVCMSYEAMFNMYCLRHGHKLGEWHEFCKTILDIPEFKLICTDIIDNDTDEE